ncbi:MAG: 3-methyladenine DNA glycosylase [Opitutus sp.]
MSTDTEISTVVRPAADWHERRVAHERRVDGWIQPHRARSSRGEKHPVYDFLFSYYGFRPAWLRRWHPGPDVVLESPAAKAEDPSSAQRYLRWPEYHQVDGGIALDLGAITEHRLNFVRWLQSLLLTMRERPAFFGCFGLHEWAMVYRQTPDEVRHNAYPLRFEPDRLAAVVEQSAICCSHFDAFRFFTPPARAFNKLQPRREDVPRNEQRGCLHANMDLYKWAFKLSPFTPSELIADCFELARDIREVDMRASPYDLRALGFTPIAIETPAGRTDYEQRQRTFSARGEPLRERLIALCARLLAS